MSETALKIFNALLAGKTVATRGVIVDAVRVKNGRLLCLSISENGRANEVDATDAERRFFLKKIRLLEKFSLKTPWRSTHNLKQTT